MIFVAKLDLEKQKRNMDLLLKGFCEGTFTKRQGKIIGFIAFLARQNKDDVAYIPKLRYFENCGVGRNHIRGELIKLVNDKVIFWNEDKMLFQINYSSNFWKTGTNRNLDRDLCDHLTELNTY